MFPCLGRRLRVDLLEREVDVGELARLRPGEGHGVLRVVVLAWELGEGGVGSGVLGLVVLAFFVCFGGRGVGSRLGVGVRVTAGE